MLYDHRGRPIAVTDPHQDLRTKAMKRFDEEFRGAMEAGGLGRYGPQFVAKLKHEMEKRDMRRHFEETHQVERSGKLDQISDQITSDHNSKQKGQIITLPGAN